MVIMTVICIGAHPDDPETGAGGTIARITATGERVICIYITSGGAGIYNTPCEEAERIRTEEANKACEILHAEPAFIGLKDGHAFPDEAAVEQIASIMREEKPRVIMTCWPLDTHPDHRATYFMALDAYSRAFGNSFASRVVNPLDADPSHVGNVPAVFLWETDPWDQSLFFNPDVYIDVDEVMEAKMDSIEAHASQNRGGSLASRTEAHGKELARHAQERTWCAEGFKRMRPPLV
jgi:LmbE family N-acetylglucosaminyl deacetylase